MRHSHKKFMLGIGLLWAMMIVGFAAVYVMVFLPQKNEMTAVCQQLEEKKAKLKQDRDLVGQENIQKKLAQIEELSERLTRFTLDFEETTEITLSISEIAKQNRLESFSIKNAPGDLNIEIEKCQTICENRFIVDFNGHFNQFAQMVNTLERNEPFIFINEFEISRSRQSEVNPAEMNLAVLVTKPAAISQQIKEKKK